MQQGRNWVGLGFKFLSQEGAEGIAEEFEKGSTVRVVHCHVVRELTIAS